jgi:DNA-binding beta-propeller fold protein YncE
VNRRQFVVAAATLPFAGRAAAAALAGGDPVALVTADTEARIAVVDLASGAIRGSIPSAAGPRSIEGVSGRWAVACHTAHGAVSIVDGRRLRVRHVLLDFDEPRYTAAAPDGRHAFVSDSKRREVVTIDVVRAAVVGRVALGGPARHLSLHEDGRALWVSLGSKARSVAVVDVSRPAAPRLVHVLRPPFLAHDVGFAPGGRHVWVTSGDRGALAVYDRRSGAVLARLAAGAPPQHVTFLAGKAFVTSGEDGTLRVHSLTGGHVVRTTRIPDGSYNVQEAAGRVLTPSLDTGTLSILDRAGRSIRTVKVGSSSHDACFVVAD